MMVVACHGLSIGTGVANGHQSTLYPCAFAALRRHYIVCRNSVVSIVIEWRIYIPKHICGKCFFHAYAMCGRLLKQGVAEALQSSFLVGLFDEERNVVVTSAIAYHSHRNVLHGICGQSFEANITPVKVAHHAYYAHISVHAHGAIFFQFVHDMVQMSVVVNAHRDANL